MGVNHISNANTANVCVKPNLVMHLVLFEDPHSSERGVNVFLLVFLETKPKDGAEPGVPGSRQRVGKRAGGHSTKSRACGSLHWGFLPRKA